MVGGKYLMGEFEHVTEKDKFLGMRLIKMDPEKRCQA
jgi:hypothetical protein